jgi:nitroimidazol reductase NimA-like FMN-containing flavoprotein (pyridoxamine 5'-phosphate oxidase superfamily)
MADRTIEELEEAESLQLISAGGIGRIAYQSRFGPAVLPVNYQWHDWWHSRSTTSTYPGARAGAC